MNQEQRDEIVDSIPEDFQIVESDEEASTVPGTLESWGDAVGHPQGPKCCFTCGLGGTCPFRAFYDAMISSVVRELAKLGRLTPVGTMVVSKGLLVQPEPIASPRPRSEKDRELNDPFGIWGGEPSYRCWVARHRDCEPEGADQGCTCSCGHQEPVCACQTTTIDLDGNLIHFLGCPQVGGTTLEKP